MSEHRLDGPTSTIEVASKENTREETAFAEDVAETQPQEKRKRFGSGEVHIDSIQVFGEEGVATGVLKTGKYMCIETTYHTTKPITDATLQVYYLINQCGNRDVRGDERYAYMDKQLVEYQGTVERSAFLQTISDVSKYLSEAMTYEHCILFLSVMDDASGSLTAEQRGALAALGLEKLSKLGYRDSYLAVIREGNVFFELTDLDKVENSETPFIKVNRQVCGVQYKIASGGLVHGNI